MSGGIHVQRARQKLDLLSHDERLIQAARYAHAFGQDVCVVLADPDDENMYVRIAAGMVIDRDEKAREEQSRRAMKK